jgi:hypothetical protein
VRTNHVHVIKFEKFVSDTLKYYCLFRILWFKFRIKVLNFDATSSSCLQGDDASPRPSTATKIDDTVHPKHVHLEAPSSHTSRVQSFEGFAGCMKTHMRWRPLQWTFLVHGMLPFADPSALLCAPSSLFAASTSTTIVHIIVWL